MDEPGSDRPRVMREGGEPIGFTPIGYATLTSDMDVSPPHLNENRSTIDHNGLTGGESFVHQEQIDLGNVMRFADPAHRQAPPNAFVQMLSFCCIHALPEVRPDDPWGYRVDTNRRQLDGEGTC